jgi:peptidoglycan-associated lipoprotein
MKKKISLVLGLFLFVACTRKYDTVKSQAEAEKLNKKSDKTVLVDNKKVFVPDKVFFDFNKADIKNEYKKSLDVVVDWLKSDVGIAITVEGHCDERGTREYNLALGQRRAEAVRKYLTVKGVNPSRIRTVSYGKERPEFLGSGEKIWSKNRRSVIIQNVK